VAKEPTPAMIMPIRVGVFRSEFEDEFEEELDAEEVVGVEVEKRLILASYVVGAARKSKTGDIC
jgi:hypothetical protein